MKLNSRYAKMLENGTDICSVKSQIKKDAADDILDILLDIFSDDRDAYDFLQENDLAEDVHPMDELDDVFEYMSPTEVLEQLGGMDLDDEWFSEYSRRTSNELGDLVDIDLEDIAKQIVSGELDCYCDEMKEVIDRMNDAIEFINGYIKRIEYKREQAKRLLEDAMNDDIDAVLNVLWNMNA